MRKKVALAAMAILMFAAFSLAACGGNSFHPNQIIQQGWDNIVTLDFNGGSAVSSSYAKLYLKDGGKIPYDKLVEKELIPVLSGYVIAGWARGEKDDDGNVTFQTNASGEVDYWDFDNDVVRDESFTLYAVWIRRYSVVIYSPDGEVAATYYLPNNNDTSAEITENNLTNVLPELDKEAKHTYLDEFYYSEDMTEDSRVTFPFTYEKGEERELSVYASWVEGNFKIVRTADDVNTALRNGRGLYLLNDVDCEGREINILSAYGSEIDGNGYAIYNFRISRSQRGRLSEYIGLFERITDNAYIHDITFRDFTVTEVNEGAPTDISVGIFAGSVSSGARFENVTVNGTVQYTIPDGYEAGSNLFIGRICGNETGLSEEQLAGITLDGTLETIPVPEQ
ncbi:MAG: InlB B-repeat-containing protein [Firmicutes bacterium]|mgnify:FL=1|nr:InlB B-repeat-containing protein [Bacillota bacterium]